MRKLSSAATGRLKPLRLFSTLLVEPKKANRRRKLAYRLWVLKNSFFTSNRQNLGDRKCLPEA